MTDPLRQIKLAVAALCLIGIVAAGYFVVSSYNRAIESAIEANARVEVVERQVTILQRHNDAAVRRIGDFEEALREQRDQALRLQEVANEARAESRRLNDYFASGDFQEDLTNDPDSTAATVSADVNAAFGVLADRTRADRTTTAP